MRRGHDNWSREISIAVLEDGGLPQHICSVFLKSKGRLESVDSYRRIIDKIFIDTQLVDTMTCRKRFIETNS